MNIISKIIGDLNMKNFSKKEKIKKINRRFYEEN